MHVAVAGQEKWRGGQARERDEADQEDESENIVTDAR
jgi:hypothetical protein